jgi:hypothetical protein
MRRLFIFTLLIQLMAVVTFAQQASQTQSPPAKGVEGNWTGSFQVPNGGEMEMAATFKKDKEVYTGSINVAGTQGDMPFKSVKVDGDKVEAQAEFETPNGNIVVNYTFTLKDDTLNGKGEVDLGGQKMVFDVNLKRAAEK